MLPRIFNSIENKMFGLQNFRKIVDPLLIQVRTKYSFKHNLRPIYRKQEGGVKIEDIISYYPRKPDAILEKVTEEPPKLFRVSRIVRLKGLPYWERRILRDFGLFDRGAVSIVKNIPENNQRLWKIKHCIKIEPINFVNGEPTEKDINYTFLKENGDCVVIKNVECMEKRLEAVEEFEKDVKELDSEILKRDSRLKWLNHY